MVGGAVVDVADEAAVDGPVLDRVGASVRPPSAERSSTDPGSSAPVSPSGIETQHTARTAAAHSDVRRSDRRAEAQTTAATGRANTHTSAWTHHG